MAMKKTDLDKHLGKKTVGAMRREPIPDRFGVSAAAPAGKREQREKDKAAGLVPFAVKLPQEIVASLQALAKQKETPLSEVVAELLQKGMKAKK